MRPASRAISTDFANSTVAAASLSLFAPTEQLNSFPLFFLSLLLGNDDLTARDEKLVWQRFSLCFVTNTTHQMRAIIRYETTTR